MRVKNSGRSYLEDLEKYILNEKEGIYLPLVQTFNDEDGKFVRGGLFKKLVPKVYNFTCAISEMRIIAYDGSSLVEACHIKPFSISGDDKVTNGIALCPNLHTAFDKGLISIDDKLKVVVSKRLHEESKSIYNLRQFHNKSILLPFGEMHYPQIQNFQWHFKTKFLK